MTQKERMEAGLIYDPMDQEIMSDQAERLELLYDFNATRPSESEKRAALLRRMLGSMGEGCYIEPPFRANWAGKHLHLGNNVYVNFNLTIVDDADIIIGDQVMIGPNVTIATANHPLHPELRARALQYNRSVTIGSNVWIGAGALIVPGRDHWRQRGDRRGERRHAGHSGQRRRGGQSMPRPAGNRGTGENLLLQKRAH